VTLIKGFTAGLILGFAAIMFRYGKGLASDTTINTVIFFGGIITILSVAAAFLTVYRGKSTFGTTGDGFLYGFAGMFDVLYIMADLISRTWPEL
jgi:hypothetical protein